MVCSWRLRPYAFANVRRPTQIREEAERRQRREFEALQERERLAYEAECAAASEMGLPPPAPRQPPQMPASQLPTTFREQVRAAWLE